MSYYTGFLPQKSLTFNIEIKDLYQYSSGIFYFDGSGISNKNIIIKSNGFFDNSGNFIYSMDPVYTNYISGDFKSGNFKCFFSKQFDFIDKILIYEEKVSNNFIISGFSFSGFEKDQYINKSISSPTVSLQIDKSIDYTIEHSGGKFSDSNLYFNFKYSQNNLSSIKIDSISINESTLFTNFFISGVQFPAIVNPGESFSFTAYNRNNSYIAQDNAININFQTNIIPIDYNFILTSQSSLVSTDFVYPELNISTNIDYGINRNLFAYWFFNLSDMRTISDMYVEVSGITGNTNINKLYTNTISQSIFGYEPAPYTNVDINNCWNGSISDVAFFKEGTIFKEDFGNIQNLKNFSWTTNWNDSLILNNQNYVINLIKISKTGFNIKDINLYLYSKNNSSGLLNYSIHKIFTTGKSDGYKNILSGLGWSTGNLINGFPSGFPSGFPFQNRDVYGFFSGFGFGKLSGYMLTGNPAYSGNVNIESAKLTPENSTYNAPIYKEKNIKISTDLNLNTGFYAFIFNAVPNSNIQNETGIFWPKMWPNNCIPPNQQTLLDYDSGKYFYQSGLENSGNQYTGISGISFIQNLTSNDSGLLFSGVKYNVALGINQSDSYFNKIYINYSNKNAVNPAKNNNFTKFVITKNLSSGIGYEDLTYGSGMYTISGGNFIKTGIIGIYKNIYRQTEFLNI